MKLNLYVYTVRYLKSDINKKENNSNKIKKIENIKNKINKIYFKIEENI